MAVVLAGLRSRAQHNLNVAHTVQGTSQIWVRGALLTAMKHVDVARNRGSFAKARPLPLPWELQPLPRPTGCSTEPAKIWGWALTGVVVHFLNAG